MLLRTGSVGYADGVSAPGGATLHSARVISNVVCSQPGPVPNPAHASDYLWQWGQFLDHDLDLTDPHAPAEPFDIKVPKGDPWFDPSSTGAKTITLSRSHHSDVAITAVRQQFNSITAFIDASNVYGSDLLRAQELRRLDGTGMLKTSPGDLLPFNVNGFANAPTDSDSSFFLAGDVRANEQLGLTAMHTLFVREHNRLAATIGAWIPGVDDNTRYEVARAMVGAEMQIITYREFLPLLLGPNAIPPYTGYDPTVDPSIENAFSTAAYRFGHSMLSATLLRLGADGNPIAAGNIALRDAFFNPHEIVSHGIEPLLRGLAKQVSQKIDPFVIDDVRNFLFGPPGSGGFDLASLNIQRGRDHGLPGYNQTRVDFGLAPVANFAQISSDPLILHRLRRVYRSVDEIDLWVGGLAEDPAPGALVGPLVQRILADQFTRLRDGDWFWYQRVMSPTLVASLEAQTLSQIIRNNTNIGNELQDNAFLVQ